jgi:adenine-specific DNA-methyltransferase
VDKLPLHTPDLTNKNYSALAALLPNAIIETIDENGTIIRSIDADVLAQEINTHAISGKEERYQFTWHVKNRPYSQQIHPLLQPCTPMFKEFVFHDKQ